MTIGKRVLECGAMSEELPNIISLGAGVQSSCMALMAAAGEIGPMPMAAIFADTQDEPKGVYEWLEWLTKQLPFPVHVVTKGSLSKRALDMRTTKDGVVYAKTDIPFFTLAQDGGIGKIMHRACTADFKLKPIMQACRKLAKIKRGQKEVGVIQWIGISMDEMRRMKPSRDSWAEIRWPLIEQRMSRNDCLNWMESHGFPKPPRSSCVYCPFHRNEEWRRLQVEEPEDFAKAVQFEKDVQAVKSKTETMTSTPFLHRSCKPLDQVDFRSDVERGQQLLNWDDECTGMCGV